jgi:hypothetical protein
MKISFLFIAIFVVTICFSQTTRANADTSSHKVIFSEDFDNNKNNWTIGSNKHESARIDSGVYYLTAVGHAYGEGQEIKIDSKKDFEIEARIKIADGNAEHKAYYSMLFWGRQDLNGYCFTFSKDGFASVEVCNGKDQSDCITKKGSLQKVQLDPDGFNVYTIKKTGHTYSFFVNGTMFYEMPFVPFFGNLIGFGAGRKVTLAVDYFKVVYL